MYSAYNAIKNSEQQILTIFFFASLDHFSPFALAICLFLNCIGVLFICLSVDHRLLYQELTQEAIDDGFLFYTTFFNAPPAIKVRHCVACAG
jgi:hypothetical protein